MALAAPTQFEVRAAGSDTLNSGGFNPGSANFITDWAVSSADTSAPVVTSATYDFVAGDVGAKFFLQSGTNGIPGWYTIASVASNAATLTASIGSAILYNSTVQCNGLNTAVGIGTASSLTSQTGGVDFSQQDAVEFALTGVTTAAANAILLSASAAKSMLGNILQITAGTNFTVGYYEITAVTAGVSITVDRNATSAAGAAGVVKIGGALSTLGTLSVGATMVTGNTMYVNGSFTRGATDTISINGVWVKGYGTFRGDGYLGRTSNVKGLITTNMPSLAYNSTFRLVISGDSVRVENLNISGTRAGPLVDCSTPNDNSVRSCKAVNASTNAAATAISIALRGTIIDCDTTLSGATGGLAAINLASANSNAIGCHVVGGPAQGIICPSSQKVVNCLITGCTGFAIAITATGGAVQVTGCTIAGNASDGINIVTGTTPLQLIYGNMITDNGGYGINMVINTNEAIIPYNFFRNNTFGNLGNAGQMAATSLAQDGNIQASSGAAYVDYTDQAGGDYTLASTSPARAASQPYAASPGAFQLVASGGGGGPNVNVVGGQTYLIDA